MILAPRVRNVQERGRRHTGGEGNRHQGDPHGPAPDQPTPGGASPANICRAGRAPGTTVLVGGDVMKTAKERHEAQRRTKLALIDKQLKSGSLVIRKMTDA